MKFMNLKNLFEKKSAPEPKKPKDEKEGLPSGDISRRRFLRGAVKAAGALVLAKYGVLPDQADAAENRPETEGRFNLKRLTEKIVHISGDSWELRSIAEDGEYYPSFHESLLTKMETPTSREVSGGFEEDLKIMTSFGTFAETTPPETAAKFLAKYNGQLPENKDLKSAIQSLIQDQHILIAVKQFLEDGGVFKSGRGRYHLKPLAIEFGNFVDFGENLQAEDTLYHELLHYIFDKGDSVLSEVHNSGGADHYATPPLDERFKIITSIRKGSAPLGEGIDPLSGFTTEGKIKEKIDLLLKENDLNGLEKYLTSEDFFKNYVHSGMTTPLSSVERNKRVRELSLKLSDSRRLKIEEDYAQKEADAIEVTDKTVYVRTQNIKNFDIKLLQPHLTDADKGPAETFIKGLAADPNKGRGYILTPDQLHDLAYLNASNAVILENSLKLAITLSKKGNTPFAAAFALPKYQETFDKFIKALTSLKQDEKKYFPVRKVGQDIMNALIQ